MEWDGIGRDGGVANLRARFQIYTGLVFILSSNLKGQGISVSGGSGSGVSKINSS